MNICNVPSPAGYACTRMPGHEGPCELVIKPEYMTRDWEACFGNLGSNWGWASVDYRGVARVHTFAPTFTASGRVALPIGKHKSQPVPAFDVNPVPADWAPMTIVRKAAPPYTTDRFGNMLPTGADPVEAADVVQAPTMASLNLEPVPFPPPACPTLPSVAPDVPFMNYVVQYRLVGSRVTCNPPPLDTDQDVLCMVHHDNRDLMLRKMTAEGFTLEGSWPANMQCTTPNNSVFESMRKGSMNYIITSDDDFYKRFNAATELAKKLNIMTKAGRIELFQAVLYGNAP